MATKTIKIGLSDADKAAMTATIKGNALGLIADAYSTSGTYAVGDLVYYNNVLYKCKTAISTAESWTAAHWEATSIEEESKNKLSKGDFDGTTGVGYADVADNLVATKGLTVNDDPMSYGIVGGAQKSAVGDGNASLNKLVCVDVVKNQKVKASNISGNRTFGGFTFTNNGDGSVTFNGDVTSNDSGNSIDVKFAVGHKVLIVVPSNVTISSPYGGSSALDYGTKIVTSNDASANYFGFYVKAGDSYSNFTFRPLLIDLTQRYGSNDVVNAIIGADASTQVARLLAYDPEILNDTDYDAGTLIPSQSAKLKTVDYNLLEDELSISGTSATGVVEALQHPFVATGKVIGLVATTNAAVPFVELYSGTTKVGYLFLNNTNTNGEKYGYGLSGNADAVIPEGTVIDSIKFYYNGSNDTAGTFTYTKIAIFNYWDGSRIGFESYKEHIIDLPNYEGHGILKVVDGKVVADGDELYPDGNSKKRYVVVDLGTLNWSRSQLPDTTYYLAAAVSDIKVGSLNYISSAPYTHNTEAGIVGAPDKYISVSGSTAAIFVRDDSYTDAATFKSAMSGLYLVYELATEEDITTDVYQSNFPVEQGGTLQFLDEDDNPIAGLQGSEIFYQKNIKAFVEAFGEAIDWDPARIERLGNLSFTPEYVNITLNPSPTGAYARAQVYNATFTIVISAALTGTANGSITFQDSEVDLSNFETEPAKAIYDMDGKKVSEAPTTVDCNIASFVGRSKSGIVLWSLLHSGVNKVKIHIEEAVPLDANGEGKIDCRASLIL